VRHDIDAYRASNPEAAEAEYMLDERRRIDNSHGVADSVLSQAYAELHAEYIKLKTSQLSDHPAAYPAAAADLSSFDPTMGINGNDRLDMDMYVYSDMANYPL